MTGRRYYVTTLSAWQRHVSHCAETHFIVLDLVEKGIFVAGSVPERTSNEQRSSSDGGVILALITADEAAHIALEGDPEAEPLPHPLARMPVSERVAQALAPLGVASGDDTFTVAEKLARVNPLLRHRVF